MAKQIPFSEHEAALLLNYYLKVLSGEMERMPAVKACSKMLRDMAQNSGIIIDEIYRNVNGISFQMASMESAFQGKTIRKPATRLFMETVELYRTNRTAYDKLLREARIMAGEKQDNETLFMEWLSEQVSNAQLSELYICYKDKGNHSNMTYEEEEAFLAQFINEADGGHITDVKAIKTAYEEKVGHETGHGQIYFVLHRHGWSKKLPRSKHPKSADPGAVEASKKLTLESIN